jgi:succinoglycan biosynthesis protein ExoA
MNAPLPFAAPSSSSTGREPPFLTVVLPALNEERYLERCVRALLDDPHPRDRMELFILDGGSADATPAIAERLAAEFPCIRLVHNPKRLQAAAFNMAMRLADPRSAYLVRCDVHAEYTSGFLTRAVAAIARSGAVLATYGDAPRAHGCFQRAVAFAQNTPLGVGAAWYRLGGVSRYVDHGKHGIFRRDAVEAVGGYDESFSHNEDSELSLRLARAGGRIWLDADLSVGYYPRASPWALARQYYLYGRGRALTLLKHRIVPRPRQLAPVFLVLVELLVLLAAAIDPRALLFFAAYAAAVGAVAAYGAAKQRSPCVLLAAIAFPLMHHAWGAGFLSRLFERASTAMSRRNVATADAGRGVV